MNTPNHSILGIGRPRGPSCQGHIPVTLVQPYAYDSNRIRTCDIGLPAWPLERPWPPTAMVVAGLPPSPGAKGAKGHTKKGRQAKAKAK